MPETKLIIMSLEKPDLEGLKEAADILRKGGLVVFPTETVYGLGADAVNADAVKRVFDAKGRPPDNPLIVHIADRHQLIDLADEVPEKGQRLAKEFWPGPLTLVVKRTFLVPDIVTAGPRNGGGRKPHPPLGLSPLSGVWG